MTQQRPPTKSRPFKVGISEPVNTVLAIWMAEAAGLYADQGLAVEIVNMNGGSRGAAELAAGRIDAMHVGLSSVVRLNREGADLRIVAALANVIRFTFFSAPRVKDAAALKGGVVAVTTFGSESDTVATLALRRLGLARDDVTVKEYGSGCGGSRRCNRAKSRRPRSTSRPQAWRASAGSTCCSIWCRNGFPGCSPASRCSAPSSTPAAIC